MDFLELRQARGVYSRVATGMPILNGSLLSDEFAKELAQGVYSRVTTGMPILNGSLLVKSGHLSRYDGHLGKLN